MTSRTTPTRAIPRIVSMTRSMLIALVAAAVGLVVFALTILLLGDRAGAPFFVAAWIAVVAGVAIALLLTRGARNRAWCSKRFAPIFSAAIVAIPTATPLAAVMFDHPTEAVAKPNARPSATKVELSTGSRVAVWTLPAKTASAKGTVIHLHGGPGMYTPNIRFKQAATFQRQGFNTVLFDQAGGGASDRLPVDQYKLTRAVADVEALRVHLGVDRVVLWGTSWGAPLAVQYAAAYPEHVAGLVLLSPGAYPGTTPTRDYSVTASNGDLPASPRIIAHHLLLGIDPTLAERLADQATAGRWMDHQFVGSAGRFTCKGDTASIATMSAELTGGANPFANALLQADLSKSTAPTNLSVPSLIARGSCDFLPASNAARFGQLLNTEVLNIQNQGHGLNFDAGLTAAIERFMKTIPSN